MSYQYDLEHGNVYWWFLQKSVCWECRLSNNSLRTTPKKRITTNKKCPICSKDMIMVGVTFSAPKKRYIKKWKELELDMAISIYIY